MCRLLGLWTLLVIGRSRKPKLERDPHVMARGQNWKLLALRRAIIQLTAAAACCY